MVDPGGTCRLISRDGVPFEVDLEAALHSKYIASCDDISEDIPVPAVAPILEKVICYCEQYRDPKNKRARDIAKPLVPNYRSLPGILDWEKEYIHVDDGILFDLVNAAHYLDIHALYDLSCAEVAARLMEHQDPVFAFHAARRLKSENALASIRAFLSSGNLLTQEMVCAAREHDSEDPYYETRCPCQFMDLCWAQGFVYPFSFDRTVEDERFHTWLVRFMLHDPEQQQDYLDQVQIVQGRSNQTARFASVVCCKMHQAAPGFISTLHDELICHSLSATRKMMSLVVHLVLQGHEDGLRLLEYFVKSGQGIDHVSNGLQEVLFHAISTNRMSLMRFAVHHALALQEDVPFDRALLEAAAMGNNAAFDVLWNFQLGKVGKMAEGDYVNLLGDAIKGGSVNVVTAILAHHGNRGVGLPFAGVNMPFTLRGHFGGTLCCWTLTPLHLAAAYRYPKVVDQLLQLHAKPEISNDHTPLTLAVQLAGAGASSLNETDGKGGGKGLWRLWSWREYRFLESRSPPIPPIEQPGSVRKRGGLRYEEVVNILEACNAGFEHTTTYSYVELFLKSMQGSRAFVCEDLVALKRLMLSNGLKLANRATIAQLYALVVMIVEAYFSKRIYGFECNKAMYSELIALFATSQRLACFTANQKKALIAFIVWVLGARLRTGERDEETAAALMLQLHEAADKLEAPLAVDCLGVRAAPPPVGQQALPTQPIDDSRWDAIEDSGGEGGQVSDVSDPGVGNFDGDDIGW